MDDLNLIEYNRRGLIPGPNEEIEAFEARVEFCLSLKTKLLDEVKIPDSEPQDDSIAVKALALTQSLYGMAPDFVPVFFSNWKLAPWHGGAAWIFQLKEDSSLGAILQLRKPFYKKSHYLGIYARDELMAHEMAHVGRMAFEEKKYEELLAYRTSKSWFLRMCGPVIQSAGESRLIIYVLATLLMMDAYFLFQGSLSAYLETQIFKLLPLVLILFALFRLTKRQKTLAQAEKNLTAISSHAKEILYRLTDKEIDTFAKQSKEEIQAYIAQDTSLRWKAIKLSYLFFETQRHKDTGAQR